MEHKKLDGYYWMKDNGYWCLTQKIGVSYFVAGNDHEFNSDHFEERGPEYHKAYVDKDGKLCEIEQWKEEEKPQSFAFPMMNELGNVHQQGMTELTYIATAAMNGLLSDGNYTSREHLVSASYKVAKAMLNEQKKHE